MSAPRPLRNGRMFQPGQHARQSQRRTFSMQLSREYSTFGICIMLLAITLCPALLHSRQLRLPIARIDDCDRLSTTARVLVVDDHAALTVLHELCEVRHMTELPDHLSATTKACLELLQGHGLECDHVYTHAVKGIAGIFTDCHVHQLRRCLPKGDLLREEQDGKVQKAEGPHDTNSFAYASTEWHHKYENERKSPGQAPSGHLRLPQYSTRDLLDVATFFNGSCSTSHFPHPDGTADSVPIDRLQWLHEHTGRLSEQFIANVKASYSSAAVQTSNEQTSESLQQSATSQQHDVQMQSDMVNALTPPSGRPGMPTAPPDLKSVPPGPAIPQTFASLITNSELLDKSVLKFQRLPPALWGLDRIDQQELPLNGMYEYGSTHGSGSGEGVTVYALDSGIRTSHQEFLDLQGVSRATYGYDFVSNKASAEDCDGHGTHVGATAIGRSVGVAKAAKLVAVRVLDCTGSGSISDTVAGLDWVAKHYQAPAVVTMSLGVTGGSWSNALEQATLSLIRDKGITVLVASGNNAVDACSISPASMPEVITVAASNMDNKFNAGLGMGRESMYRWSNTGSCMDLFAPGVEIWSACGGASRCPKLSDDAYTWASGTSMAVPLVAGSAALYLGSKPQAKPAEVKQALLQSASRDKLNDSRMLPGTPNRLLYSRGVEAAAEAPAVQASG